MHGTIKVRKWGNSIGIVIPQFVAQQMNIQAGSMLRISYKENTLELTSGLTDKERLDQFIREILLENERLIREQERVDGIIKQ